MGEMRSWMMSRNEGGFMRHNHATPNQNKFIRQATPPGSKIAAVAVHHHQSDPATLTEPHFTPVSRQTMFVRIDKDTAHFTTD